MDTNKHKMGADSQQCFGWKLYSSDRICLRAGSSDISVKLIKKIKKEKNVDVFHTSKLKLMKLILLPSIIITKISYYEFLLLRMFKDNIENKNSSVHRSATLFRSIRIWIWLVRTQFKGQVRNSDPKNLRHWKHQLKYMHQERKRGSR